MQNLKNKKLNILISAYCVDKNDIGEAKMSYEWITRIADHTNITVITSGSRIHETTGLENDQRIKLIILKPRLSFKWCDTFDRAVHPGYLEFFLRAKKIIPDIIEKNKIDLCHHLAPRSIRYPAPFINQNKPFIVGPFHGGLKAPKVMKQLEGKESFFFNLRKIDDIRIAIDPFLKKHFGKAARLIVSAPYMTNVIPSKYKQKTEVISGIAIENHEISENAIQPDNKKVKIIYVGRLSTSKGIEILIKALQRTKNDNYELDLFGKGELENYCKSLAKQLNVENKINFKGFHPLSEIMQAYKKSSIYILPSLKEPAGRTVMEAMASGLPIITVNQGGPAYAVDDSCGIKIPISNLDKMIDDLAIAIDDLVSNPEKRLQMGQNSIQRIKDNFTWPALVKKIISTYEEVINEQNN